MLNSEPTPRTRVDCACRRIHHEHGTRGAFDIDGCRCFTCRVGYSQARRSLRMGGTTSQIEWAPTIGVQRRMQALFALGWNWSALAARLDVTTEAARQAAMATNRTRCHPATVARVVALYDALSMTRPEGRHAARARTLAARRGWLPPLAWDDETIDTPEDFFYNGKTPATRRIPREIDEIAIERAMRGDPVRLTTAEKSVAVVTMTGWGYSAREIAEKLGTTDRSVVRRRASAAA